MNKENSVTNCSNLHDELKKNSVLNGTSTILCPYGMYIPEILTSEEIEERAEDVKLHFRIYLIFLDLKDVSYVK